MLILASASPRRQELLKLITEDFQVIVSDTDENLPHGTPPYEAVKILALRKARAVAMLHPKDTIIGADTVVALDGQILGKPADEEDAFRMLRALSGKTHQVYTGVAILCREQEIAFAEETAVRFISLTDSQIWSYIRSGEPMDKAGAYGIQGGAALFADRLEGDYYNVMGLPVCRLNGYLRDFSDKIEPVG